MGKQVQVGEWTATYRVQLNRDFPLEALRSIVPYLAELGISHVYLSPVLQASAGSNHGYDVVDPRRVSSDLGGEEAFDRLRETLSGLGLRLLLDIVPNHMATLAENRWWWDVLRRGPESPFAQYFDLRWQTDAGGRTCIDLPVLDADLDVELATGKLKLEVVAGESCIVYRGAQFPLAPDDAAPGTVAAAKLAPHDLKRLLARQHYRLVNWRNADERMSYRRFFDINGLVGFRTEEESAFEASHRRVLKMVEQRDVDGLRVDHIDGLRDPKEYCQRLRRAVPDCGIWVEKILARDERLPEGWPVDGTTGYDFLNMANGLFVDRKGEERLTRTYHRFSGRSESFAEVLRESKRQVLSRLLGADVRYLADLFQPVWQRAGRTDELSGEDVQRTFREAIAALPIYRTYIQPERGEISEADREYIGRALANARQALGALEIDVLRVLEETLLLERTGGAETELVLAFQQTCGPAMAKGCEDTALYRYYRLASLNEVGGDPSRFGTSVDEFHDFCRFLAAERPDTLLTTSTHDTKRGEDVRLRINAISEFPDEWTRLIERLEPGKGGARDIARNDRYLLYQTMAGAWPIDEARIVAYMTKAVREAKIQSSWRKIDEAYEREIAGEAARVLSDESLRAEITAFVELLDSSARPASLAQTLIKLTAPGIPDFYQGGELWDLSLVDPDNRRAVDFLARRGLLAKSRGLSAQEAMEHIDSGLPKLWLIARVLEVRREQGPAFAGQYQALDTVGSQTQRLVAYLRGGRVATVAPRLLGGLDGGWGDAAVELPRGRWVNAIDGAVHAGGSVSAAALLRAFPGALLLREGQ